MYDGRYERISISKRDNIFIDLPLDGGPPNKRKLPMENSSKTFYDKDEHYSDEGLELDNEMNAALSVIYKKWIEKGYKIRGITGLLHSTVASMGNYQILDEYWKPK